MKDLIVGEEYFLTWGNKPNWRCVFLGVIQEYEMTEILIAQIKRKKWVGTNMPYFYEIGIGKTKSEAIKNYGRLKNEKIEGAYKSREEAETANFHFLDNY